MRNTLRYLLGNLDGFSEASACPYAEMPELERWVLHRLTELDARMRRARGALRLPRPSIPSSTISAPSTCRPSTSTSARTRSTATARQPAPPRRAHGARHPVHRCLTAWLAPVLVLHGGGGLARAPVQARRRACTCVCNRGMSFGLFNTGDPVVPWILGAIAIAVAIGLVWWLARARHWLVIAGLGLVLGGAIGNLIDRVLYGAVVDFVLLHAGSWHFPAFNVADSAITLGVVALLWDSLFNKPESPK
jgi:signal peptidase II